MLKLAVPAVALLVLPSMTLGASRLQHLSNNVRRMQASRLSRGVAVALLVLLLAFVGVWHVFGYAPGACHDLPLLRNGEACCFEPLAELGACFGEPAVALLGLPSMTLGNDRL